MPIEEAGAPRKHSPPREAETGALSVEQVQAALDQLQLGIDIIEFDSSTATSQQAADNVGCQLGQIVKSLGIHDQQDQAGTGFDERRPVD